MQIKNMTMTAMMVCMMIICSWLTVPTPIPFTMQTFAVFCCLLLLDGKSALAVMLLYFLLGCVGLPVFSGFHGGIGYILGPTGGYIIGFVFIAFLYFIFETLFPGKIKLRLPALACGLIICYFFGTVWFIAVYGMSGTNYSVGTVILLCVIPYVIPDLIKLALAWCISGRIRTALHLSK